MGRVNWRQLDEADFNDLAESLLVREHTREGLIAMAVDGRGGDGGIDIDVRVEKTQQLVHVFQLKYFPEGFSGGHLKRRQQIKKSLRKAIETEAPPVWSLVVPRKVTTSERKAVRAMRDGHNMTVRFVTPVEMDLLLAKHPDIEERFTIDRSVELLRAANREEAALQRPGDLHGEVRRLQGRLDGLSEYWGRSFSLDPTGTFTEALYAKRADAPDREPLRIDMSMSFAPADHELKSQFETAMKFGFTDPVIFPGSVIESFKKVGPAWFAGEGRELASFEMHPHEEPHIPQRIRVEVHDYDGRTLARLTGASTALSRGYGGITLSARLDGGVTQLWTIPVDVSDEGSVTIEVDFVGSTAHEIRRALRFANAYTQVPTLALSIADFPAIVINLSSPPTGPLDERFEEFIEDLCFLEDHFDTALRYPSAPVDSSDRIWARVLRLLASGEATAHPFTGTFGGVLEGGRDASLDALVGDGSAIVARHDHFGIQLFGEDLILDDIAFYTHSARIDNSEDVQRALDSGTAEGMRIEIRPTDGLPWVIYSPRRIAARGEEHVITHPWDIKGIAERPGYDSLPNRRGKQGVPLRALPQADTSSGTEPTP